MISILEAFAAVLRHWSGDSCNNTLSRHHDTKPASASFLKTSDECRLEWVLKSLALNHERASTHAY